MTDVVEIYDPLAEDLTVEISVLDTTEWPNVITEITDLDTGLTEIVEEGNVEVDVTDLITQTVEVEAPDAVEVDISAFGEKGEKGDTGPQGPAGPQGPTGAPGPSDNVAYHESWIRLDVNEMTINHNLHYQPAGWLVVDTGGTQWEPSEIINVDDDTTILRFRVNGNLTIFSADVWAS
jgi:hypothetical protein